MRGSLVPFSWTIRTDCDLILLFKRILKSTGLSDVIYSKTGLASGELCLGFEAVPSLALSPPLCLLVVDLWDIGVPSLATCLLHVMRDG